MGDQFVSFSELLEGKVLEQEDDFFKKLTLENFTNNIGFIANKENKDQYSYVYGAQSGTYNKDRDHSFGKLTKEFKTSEDVKKSGFDLKEKTQFIEGTFDVLFGKGSADIVLANLDVEVKDQNAAFDWNTRLANALKMVVTVKSKDLPDDIRKLLGENYKDFL